MARLPEKERQERDNKVIADWKAGVSQNQLAKRYGVSPATINKLCKGVEQTNVDIVNARIAIASELMNKSEYEVNSIDNEVNEALRYKSLIHNNATKLAGKLFTMAEQIDTPMDMKILADANDRLAITLKVAERHAPRAVTALQINTEEREVKQGIGELYKVING
jgi:DNA-binding MurR/RpiR family transcriptional regulator